mgnify:CR=1 FL=1
MFNCSLCRAKCEEWVYFSSHCSTCEEIRRIISLYSQKDVLDTLRFVYLRDEEDKRTNRTRSEHSKAKRLQQSQQNQKELVNKSIQKD